jgi:hypothetical protein
MTTIGNGRESTTQSGPLEEVVGVIQNVLYRQDPNYVAAGDLFLESSQAIYVAYIAGISPAPIVYGAAAALGGLVGALAVSDTNVLANKKSFLAGCDTPRTVDWGLPVNDRAAKKGRFKIFIPRAEIESIETEGGIAVKTAKTTYVFGYAFEEASWEAAALFTAWLAQDLPNHWSVARFGLHRQFTYRPQDLIRAFLRNESVPESFLGQVSGDGEYMNSFFAGLALVDRNNLEPILDRCQSAPEAFRLRIIHFLKGRAEGGDSIPQSVYLWGVAAVIFFVLSVAFIDRFPLVVIVLIVCLGGLIATLADWLRGPRRYFQQIKRLKSQE